MNKIPHPLGFAETEINCVAKTEIRIWLNILKSRILFKFGLKVALRDLFKNPKFCCSWTNILEVMSVQKSIKLGQNWGTLRVCMAVSLLLMRIFSLFLQQWSCFDANFPGGMHFLSKFLSQNFNLGGLFLVP